MRLRLHQRPVAKNGGQTDRMIQPRHTPMVGSDLQFFYWLGSGHFPWYPFLTECLVSPISRSRSTFYIEMSMVLVDASSDSSSNARFWASLIVPCLQGCSWPWRAVAGMHVALRAGQELPRLKMFCSLDFARLAADQLWLGSVT